MKDLDRRLEKYIEKTGCSCKSLNEHKDELTRHGLSEDYAKASKVFKVLGDENRLKIVLLLDERSYCQCELEFILNLSQPTIAHHLKRLSNAGIIRLEKDGRYTRPLIADKHMLEVIKQFMEFL